MGPNAGHGAKAMDPRKLPHLVRSARAFTARVPEATDGSHGESHHGRCEVFFDAETDRAVAAESDGLRSGAA